MSFYDYVYREVLHDWLDARRDLAADERPDRAEYEDEPCSACGGDGFTNEGRAAEAAGDSTGLVLGDLFCPTCHGSGKVDAPLADERVSAAALNHERTP